jgi:hypothetical protein
VRTRNGLAPLRPDIAAEKEAKAGKKHKKGRPRT